MALAQATCGQIQAYQTYAFPANMDQLPENGQTRVMVYCTAIFTKGYLMLRFPLGTVQSLLYNMAGAKRNEATTFLSSYRTG